MVNKYGGMKSWDKIITLHRILTKNKYPTPLQTLLDELECSESQFYKIRTRYQQEFKVDIDCKDGGYCINDKDGTMLQCPGVWFKTDEIVALLSLEAMIASLDGGFTSELLTPLKEKYEVILKAGDISISELKDRIKLLSIGKRHENPKILKTLMNAVLYKKATMIEHKKLGENEIEKSRIISPQNLLRYKDNWYIDAWCHMREDLRTFSVSRILSATVADVKWEAVDAKRLKSHVSDTYGIFPGPTQGTAKILFKGIAAEEVSKEKWHRKQKGVYNKERMEYTLEVPYGNTQELIMDILRWRDLAEVISPVALREEIASIINNMQNIYK